MCGVTKRFQYWGQQDSKQKLQFYLGFKSIILQMSEPDEGQAGWECGTIARVRLEHWKDCEELWDKVVLLCNSLRYLSTMLVFYVLHQEIEPCVTDINPAPIIIRPHNTLKRHIYCHSWQFLSPGDASRQQQEPPTKTRLAFLFIDTNTDLWPTWKAVLTHKTGRQPPFPYHRMPREKIRICL